MIKTNIISLLSLGFLLPVLRGEDIQYDTAAFTGFQQVTQWTDDPDAVEDWGVILNAELPTLREGAVVVFPAEHAYVIKTPVELRQSVTFLFEAGAEVWGSGVPHMFSIIDGKAFRFEGIGGRAKLALQEGIEGAVIELTEGKSGITPDLTVKSLHLVGYRGINGVHSGGYVADAASLNILSISDCHFEASDMHVGIRQGELDSLSVEGSLFTGDVRYGIYVASPIKNGASVRGNRVLGAGMRAISLGGGVAHMIDSGAVNYLSSVIVHDNHVIGGGHRAGERTSYIMGILVYGNNVSIQGNVVRDFNRGEPVPGERIGRHFKLSDGTYHRGPWISDDGEPRRRLAGAAIYAKARYGVISNNVCTNSGWRAVIEVKTGGREPYFLVANNIVDGSALSIEDSFGFEPNIAKALWVNNVVSNMPNMAFKVSNRMQSAYINNAIYDSKYGFIVSDTAHPNPELILNNHFVNVEVPVAGLVDNRFTAAVSPPPPVFVQSVRSLPEPNEQQRGRMAFVASTKGDQMLVVKKTGDHFSWVPLGGEGEAVKTSHAGTVEWRTVGGNLALNPLQDRDGPTTEETRRWESQRQYNEHPYGWMVTTSLDEADLSSVFKYVNVSSPSGTRVLQVGDENTPGMNWLLEQRLNLQPGKTYRARVRVARYDSKSSLNLILENGDARESSPSTQTRQWETLEAILTIPLDGPPASRLRLHCSRGGEGRLVLIDEVSVEEIEMPDRS